MNNEVENDNAQIPLPSPKRFSLRLQPNFNMPTGLAIVITAAGFIVALGYLFYWHNDYRKYDIRRPGDGELSSFYDIEDEDINSSAPIDAVSVRKKLDFLKQEINAINGLSGFNQNDLSDQNIQLAPVVQPSL